MVSLKTSLSTVKRKNCVTAELFNLSGLNVCMPEYLPNSNVFTIYCYLQSFVEFFGIWYLFSVI